MEEGWSFSFLHVMRDEVKEECSAQTIEATIRTTEDGHIEKDYEEHVRECSLLYPPHAVRRYPKIH